jgi:hypothetical protein
MELVAIETSRIVYLNQLVRPAGQTYLPGAIADLVQRYSFAKFPSVEDLARDPTSFSFSMGKFQDVQINEFQVYPDGLIASARAPTELVDAFVSDLLSWSEKKLGLVQSPLATPEKFVESAIVVKSAGDLARSLLPMTDAVDLVNTALHAYPNWQPYVPSGFALEPDPAAYVARRRPIRFGIERRVNIPFRDNIFFSVAPLHTTEHLKLLGDLETVAVGQKTKQPTTGASKPRSH